jgi:hypothetical protein
MLSNGPATPMMTLSSEDDYSYLKEDKVWEIRLSHRIVNEEMKTLLISAVKALLKDIRNNKNRFQNMLERITSKGAIDNCFRDVILPSSLDFVQKKEIEGCFVATFMREILLRKGEEDSDTTKERKAFSERVSTEYEAFLIDLLSAIPFLKFPGEKLLTSEENQKELLLLFRFERAILLVKSYMSGLRNKGLFLIVGNLLEGSENAVRYVTGGHSSKETKRRVLLIEAICDIKPRKRTRKLISSTDLSNMLTTSDPSSSFPFVDSRRYSNKRSKAPSSFSASALSASSSFRPMSLDNVSSSMEKYSNDSSRLEALSSIASCFLPVANFSLPSSWSSSFSHLPDAVSSFPSIYHSVTAVTFIPLPVDQITAMEERIEKIRCDFLHQQSLYSLYFRYQQAIDDENDDLADSLHVQLLSSSVPSGSASATTGASFVPTFRNQEDYEKERNKAIEDCQQFIDFYKKEDALHYYEKIKEIKFLKKELEKSTLLL